jgi:Raf kinase inhibitor-like YbhB/YbcL family protein
VARAVTRLLRSGDDLGRCRRPSDAGNLVAAGVRGETRERAAWRPHTARTRPPPGADRRFARFRSGYGHRMAQKLNVADLRVTSPAFDNHARIPERHTGDGDDVAPALSWTGAPEGTKAFAVVVHDPDAPLVDGFTHWVAYGIAGDAVGLAEGGGEAVQGTNSFGNQGYGGPAPPPGHGPHHYYFWVYALDEDLGLEPGLDRRALLDRIEDHVIEQARMVGVYQH